MIVWVPPVSLSTSWPDVRVIVWVLAKTVEMNVIVSAAPSRIGQVNRLAKTQVAEREPVPSIVVLTTSGLVWKAPTSARASRGTARAGRLTEHRSKWRHEWRGYPARAGWFGSGRHNRRESQVRDWRRRLDCGFPWSKSAAPPVPIRLYALAEERLPL